ncbi:MAG: hypothetical protein ACJ75H_24745 [Thermoanaerobaculia bacterium]
MLEQMGNRENGDRGRRRSGAVHAGLAGLLVALVLVLGWIAARADAAAAQPWKRLSPREAQYLEKALEQIRRMKGNFDWIGRQPLAAGALAAAALAAEGRPDAPQLRAEVASWTTGVLDACAKWTTNECARSQLPLQRLALQYPEALPAELLARLKAAVSATAAPPNEALIRDPWGFGDTENQRMISMSRSLVAQVVAGTPDSPAAKAWGAFAEAFLRAHERDGWYEAESPGYLALSVTGLLQLADHAPQAEVRELASRQLDVIFASWAQRQVGGYPAGPKSRTSAVWALSRRSSPWQAWAWLAVGLGEPGEINFMDRPELPVSRYRVPEGVARLLAGRRKQAPYEIRERRSIAPAKRKDVDAAMYTYATPDYVLGVSQSVANLGLRVSGGQEIVATLYAEGPKFAPVYLWSRTKTPKSNESDELNTLDQAVGNRNLVLARLDTPGAGTGHAFLSAPWSRPEVIGDVAVSRCGDAYVALVTKGGWEVAPALEKFPEYYAVGKARKRELAGSWVAVPRVQPASVALLAGRRGEDGDFEAFKSKAAAARLSVGTVSEDAAIRFTAPGGAASEFQPGRQAKMAGSAVEAVAYPRMASPFLNSPEAGRWSFGFDKFLFHFDPKDPKEVAKPSS